MDYIFEKGKFTEDELEQAIIELFERQDKKYTVSMKIFCWKRICAHLFRRTTVLQGLLTWKCRRL